MTPFRRLCACLTFLSFGLLAVVSDSDAQMRGGMNPCGCGYGMQVQQYTIRMQYQQQYMQQMQMQMRVQQEMQRVQMQQMRIQQQQQRVHMEQQRIRMQTAKTQMAMSKVHMATNRVHMQPTRVHMEMQKVHLTPGRVHMEPVKVHLAMNKVNVQVQKVQLQTQKVSIRPVKTSIQMQKVSIQPVKTSIQMQKVSIQPVKTSIQVGKVRADMKTVMKTVNCYKDVTITVVTYDVRCGKCHQQQTPMPTMVRGSTPRLPNMLPNPQTPRFPTMVGNPRRPLQPGITNPGRPGMPNIVSRPNPMPGMPNIVSRPSQTPEMPNLVSQPRPMPGMPNIVSRPQPQPRLPEMMQQPRPTSVVLREPLGPGSMPGTLPYGLTQMPQGGPVVDLWALPAQPMVASDRPTSVLRNDPNLYGVTGRPTSTAKKPTRLTEMVTTTKKKAATRELLEGLSGTENETSRPLPADVLQAPTSPATQVVRSELRGGLGEGELVEGIVDPTNAGPPESEPGLSARSPLSPEDLQTPALPELPASILVLPPDSGPLPVIDDPSMVPGLPEAPETPEFTPRAPDPVAGVTPRQDSTVRRLAAESSLAQPALPSDPTVPLGPG
jgi:hypothetical protein